MRTESGTRSVAALAWALMLALPAAFATEVAIDGYSPVSYFEVGRAELGDPAFSVEYDDKLWYLASAEQKARFEADPEQYAPVFGAFCPFSLANGMQREIDPTNFKIVGGALLLFHKSEGADGLAGFEAADDQQALLREARGEFLKIRF